MTSVDHPYLPFLNFFQRYPLALEPHSVKNMNSHSRDELVRHMLRTLISYFGIACAFRLRIEEFAVRRLGRVGN